MDILHGDEGERALAIREAARGPALFTRLHEQFGGAVPSEANLKGYLLRNGFAISAVEGVIDAYKETMELVASVEKPYDSGSEDKSEPIAALDAAKPVERSVSTSVAASFPVLNDKPFAIEFAPGGVRISADIRDQQTLAQLVSALQALSGFLSPTKEADDDKQTDAILARND